MFGFNGADVVGGGNGGCVVLVVVVGASVVGATVTDVVLLDVVGAVAVGATVVGVLVVLVVVLVVVFVGLGLAVVGLLLPPHPDNITMTLTTAVCTNSLFTSCRLPVRERGKGVRSSEEDRTPFVSAVLAERLVRRHHLPCGGGLLLQHHHRAVGMLRRAVPKP